MALKIIEEKIVGKIDNLQDKLEGKIPIDRLELLVLINSWGRIKSFYTKNSQNKDIYIESCEAKECYDLSKLDTSKITNMDSIFCFSNHNGDISNWNMSNVTNMSCMFLGAKKFNGDISKWDVSKVTDINGMFYGSEKFNSDISNWDVSNVKDISYMFSYTEEFNQNISSWNTKNVINMQSIFLDAKAFLDKYNSGKPLPNYTNNIKEWIINNRDKMNEIDIKVKHGEKIDIFFHKINSNKNNEINKE